MQNPNTPNLVTGPSANGETPGGIISTQLLQFHCYINNLTLKPVALILWVSERLGK